MESTEAFRVLASADRQYLLHELAEQNGESTVGELSRRVAVRRHRTTCKNVTGAEIDRARVRLVHIHVPQLVERGVIDVDRQNGCVAFTEDENVDLLFEAAEELDEWPPEPELSHPP
ncbi:DUF7344 domain-containing protein [Natrinema salaciae]|uniref:DUF7344 domain-containing protein n=1 Tax=Natrinema salaciae TaxID=1186196 RepID=A0A1H9R5W5_9EURY|nr:hypothetical protein [Natrinema salaciae]SER67925.1 hypothetical protein SAMN04489841_4284 [Natrinema salaciae]